MSAKLGVLYRNRPKGLENSAQGSNPEGKAGRLTYDRRGVSPYGLEARYVETPRSSGISALMVEAYPEADFTTKGANMARGVRRIVPPATPRDGGSQFSEPGIDLLVFALRRLVQGERTESSELP